MISFQKNNWCCFKRNRIRRSQDFGSLLSWPLLPVPSSALWRHASIIHLQGKKKKKKVHFIVRSTYRRILTGWTQSLLVRFFLPSLPKEIQPLVTHSSSKCSLSPSSVSGQMFQVLNVWVTVSVRSVHTCVGGKVEIQTQDLVWRKGETGWVRKGKSVWTRMAHFVYSFVPFVSVPVLIMI